MFPLPPFMNLLKTHNYVEETHNKPIQTFPETIMIKDQKHEWREQHCPKCKDGIITEKYFDESAAIEYLDSIGELTLPDAGIPIQLHLMSACHIAQQRGDNVEFFKEKSYPCVHFYCGRNKDMS